MSDLSSPSPSGVGQSCEEAWRKSWDDTPTEFGQFHEDRNDFARACVAKLPPAEISNNDQALGNAVGFYTCWQILTSELAEKDARIAELERQAKVHEQLAKDVQRYIEFYGSEWLEEQMHSYREALSQLTKQSAEEGS